jgi:serine/threonine-protein kinase ULK/ATG1
MRSIVGTPLYMSPQILARTKYTNKSDVWSVGLIYYELLHGYTPWPAKNEVQLANNIMNKAIVYDSWISESSRNFINRCLKIK